MKLKQAKGLDLSHLGLVPRTDIMDISQAKILTKRKGRIFRVPIGKTESFVEECLEDIFELDIVKVISSLIGLETYYFAFVVSWIGHYLEIFPVKSLNKKKKTVDIANLDIRKHGPNTKIVIYEALWKTNIALYARSKVGVCRTEWQDMFCIMRDSKMGRSKSKPHIAYWDCGAIVPLQGEFFIRIGDMYDISRMRGCLPKRRDNKKQQLQSTTQKKRKSLNFDGSNLRLNATSSGSKFFSMETKGVPPGWEAMCALLGVRAVKLWNHNLGTEPTWYDETIEPAAGISDQRLKHYEMYSGHELDENY